MPYITNVTKIYEQTIYLLSEIETYIKDDHITFFIPFDERFRTTNGNIKDIKELLLSNEYLENLVEYEMIINHYTDLYTLGDIYYPNAIKVSIIYAMEGIVNNISEDDLTDENKYIKIKVPLLHKKRKIVLKVD